MSTIATPRAMSPSPVEEAPAPVLSPSEFYRFTVDQYERMGEAGILTEDDRVELIDGYVVAKMGKGPEHFWVVETVDEMMKALLAGRALCTRREGTTRMPPVDEPEPDIAVARGTRASYLRRNPDASEIALVVEVSDTTYHRDRGKKWEANARSGIPVYWIVNLSRRRVEVYTDPSSEGYKSRRDYHFGESIPVVIDGQELGRIPVDAVLPPAEDNGVRGA